MDILDSMEREFSSADTDESPRHLRKRWLAKLDEHGAEHGVHMRLGPDHGALMTEDGDTLLVTFELADTIREERQGGLPFGLEVAGKDGWSQLCLYSETDGFFRSKDIYSYFDKLVDEGVFHEFDKVIFYGAGPMAYAAAAFSVVAPGASVLLVNPIATLDPRVVPWDRRYLEMRRTDFTSRYGYAPAMMEAAAEGWVISDPASDEDAGHAGLFTRDGVMQLKIRNLGDAAEHDLDEMKILTQLLLAAGRGKLTERRFYHLWRRRQSHQPYLRRMMNRLESSDDAMRSGIWARAALERIRARRFRRALHRAEEALQEEGRALPPQKRREAAE